MTLRLTVPEKPFRLPTVTVYDVEFPRRTVCDDGEAEIVKSGGAIAVTVRVSVALCVSEPDVPVTVSG